MTDAADLRRRLAPQVRVMQIIVGAMLFGTVVFGAVVLVIGDQQAQAPAPIQGKQVEPTGGGPIATIALVVGLVGLFAQQVAGRVVTDQAARKAYQVAPDEPEKLGEAYMTGLVVACAICEGAAFFNLIAHMVSRSPLNLAMAGLLAASIAIKLPFLERVADWVEAKLRRFREEASL